VAPYAKLVRGNECLACGMKMTASLLRHEAEFREDVRAENPDDGTILAIQGIKH